MFRTTHSVEPRSASEQAAYAKWLDERSDREDGAGRPHSRRRGGDPAYRSGSSCYSSAVVIFVFMLFFADSAERVVVQATMMGGVAIVITSTLLLLWFLDHPYHSGVGSLRPVAMERTADILKNEAAAIGREAHYSL